MYICNYCNELHLTKTRSVEHIIPEGLLNKNYILNNVCILKNNFLANSFENQFLNDPLINEILLIFKPPQNRRINLGVVETDQGTIENFWYENGKYFFRDKPKTETIMTVPIKIQKENEKEIIYDIKLPFEIIRKSTSANPDFNRERLQKRIDEKSEKLNDYIKELFSNPQIDPEFYKFAIENKLDLSKTPRLLTSIQEISTSYPEAFSAKNKSYDSNIEVWVRQILKIAWTYTCKVFGRAQINNQYANNILNYIFWGAVDPEFVKQLESEAGQSNRLEIFRNSILVTEDIKFDLYFWNGRIEESIKKINQISHLLGDCKKYFDICNEERKQNLRFFLRNIIRLKECFLDYNRIDEIKSRRFHSLRLENSLFNRRNILVCHVQLFGGVIESSIILADKHLTFPSDYSEKIISF